MKRSLSIGVFAVSLLALLSISAFAQQKGSLTCRDNNWNGDRLVSNCEMREQTIAPTGGVIGIDGRQNGGISVKGWDQNQILVRARVQAAAPTAAEAETLGHQVTIEVSGAKIYANGPEQSRSVHWEVTYEVFVPRKSDLSLEAHNGGIVIDGVSGSIDFNGLNGGVVLRGVGGSVHGSTTNGGLLVELSGDRWDGETLDVKTTNGGVMMRLPLNYSAHLEAGTVNGNISVDFPVNVQGRINKELAVNVGSGGATVRAMTTNGGVRIGRAGSGEN